MSYRIMALPDTTPITRTGQCCQVVRHGPGPFRRDGTGAGRSGKVLHDGQTIRCAHRGSITTAPDVRGTRTGHGPARCTGGSGLATGGQGGMRWAHPGHGPEPENECRVAGVRAPVVLCHGEACQPHCLCFDRLLENTYPVPARASATPARMQCPAATGQRGRNQLAPSQNPRLRSRNSSQRM